MTVYVEFQSDDEAKGLALAKEAAHEAHRKLHAEDPSRYPHDPKVDSFTKS